MGMGPENRRIKAVHRFLPETVYHEKMHNPYRGGTPDVWYSGRKADLWIEWKWRAGLPKKGRVVPALSALQQKWLRDRFAQGRTVWTVMGTRSGNIRFVNPAEWEEGLTLEECRRRLMSNQLTADYIVLWVGQ
jgi:hypothetical protein